MLYVNKQVKMSRLDSKIVRIKRKITVKKQQLRLTLLTYCLTNM